MKTVIFWVIYNPTYSVILTAAGILAEKLLNCFNFVLFRIGMRGRELMGGVGKTMMQSGGTFGTFMAIGMGIRC